MGFTFLRKYFRSRNVYWNVVRELSYYTDRELHDLGIDRADIQQIARTAAAEYTSLRGVSATALATSGDR